MTGERKLKLRIETCRKYDPYYLLFIENNAANRERTMICVIKIKGEQNLEKLNERAE